MKWLCFVVGLVLLTSGLFAQSEDEDRGIGVKLDVSLGLVGAGVFLPSNEDQETIFAPSVGGLLRMAYPFFTSDEEKEGKKDTYLDGGILVYVTTAIIEETHVAFIGGGGISLGFFNGVITVSFCPTYVYDTVAGVETGSKSGFYWTLVFTSDSLRF